jgi:hypothetical protein
MKNQIQLTNGQVFNENDIQKFKSFVSSFNYELLCSFLCDPDSAPDIEGFKEEDGQLIILQDDQFIPVSHEGSLRAVIILQDQFDELLQRFANINRIEGYLEKVKISDVDLSKYPLQNKMFDYGLGDEYEILSEDCDDDEIVIFNLRYLSDIEICELLVYEMDSVKMSNPKTYRESEEYLNLRLIQDIIIQNLD